MTRRQVFLPDAARASAKAQDGELVLEGAEAHHLVKVLRARPGDGVTVLNGAGLVGEARVMKAAPRAAVLKMESLRECPRSQPRIALELPLLKAKAFDLSLRLATELGVATIQPVATAHAEVPLAVAQSEGKREKWRTICIEACKQSRNPWLPELRLACAFEALTARASETAGALKLIASLRAGSIPLRKALAAEELSTRPRLVKVLVGPEGDFSLEEYDKLQAAGYRPWSLGSNILRSETAVAYVLAALQEHLA